jgi:hypothetical protein
MENHEATRIHMIFATITRQHPAIVGVINEIESIAPGVVDPTFDQAETVQLSIEGIGGRPSLSISLNGAFVCVAAPDGLVQITSRSPSSRGGRLLTYHSDGRVTEGDSMADVIKPDGSVDREKLASLTARTLEQLNQRMG